MIKDKNFPQFNQEAQKLFDNVTILCEEGRDNIQ